MLVLKGYYNGKEYISLENANVKPNHKVIMILDEYLKPEGIKNKPFRKYVGKLSNESYAEITEALKETEKVNKNEC